MSGKERRKPGQQQTTNDEAADRRSPQAGSFSGDIRGGGASLGADLGRGGTSTPTGDIAGGGEPGSLVDFGDGTVTDRDAVPTGGAGAMIGRDATGGRQRSSEAALPEPARDLPRSATDMAPGIPTGSGQGIDQALEQPDSEIGGGVAADTTVGLDTGDARDRDTVRKEDKGRTTL